MRAILTKHMRQRNLNISHQFLGVKAKNRKIGILSGIPRIYQLLCCCCCYCWIDQKKKKRQLTVGSSTRWLIYEERPNLVEIERGIVAPTIATWLASKDLSPYRSLIHHPRILPCTWYVGLEIGDWNSSLEIWLCTVEHVAGELNIVPDAWVVVPQPIYYIYTYSYSIFTSF